jgi:hypothetical protein
MDINEIYQIVLYSTAKNLSQGYVSPDDFNLTINQAQKSYVAYLLGSFQQYTPGRAVARVEFGQNTIVRTRLAPIIYWDALTVDAFGFCPYPSDYLQTDAMFKSTGYDRIRSVQQDSLYSYIKSQIDPVESNPIYILENTGFHFFPENIGSAKLSYVGNPPDMIWGYYVDSNGIPVYVAPGDAPPPGFTLVPSTGSVNPVWDDASILEIIIRALAIIGVNLQLNVVEQYSMAIKNQGQ